MKNRQLERQKLKGNKKQGCNYTVQSGPGVWGVADGNTAFLIMRNIYVTYKFQFAVSPTWP